MLRKSGSVALATSCSWRPSQFRYRGWQTGKKGFPAFRLALPCRPSTLRRGGYVLTRWALSIFGIAGSLKSFSSCLATSDIDRWPRRTCFFGWRSFWGIVISSINQLFLQSLDITFNVITHGGIFAARCQSLLHFCSYSASNSLICLYIRALRVSALSSRYYSSHIFFDRDYFVVVILVNVLKLIAPHCVLMISPNCARKTPSSSTFSRPETDILDQVRCLLVQRLHIFLISSISFSLSGRPASPCCSSSFEMAITFVESTASFSMRAPNTFAAYGLKRTGSTPLASPFHRMPACAQGPHLPPLRETRNICYSP